MHTMLDLLDKLRQKSPHVRERVAIGASALFSLAIFALWVSSWDVQYAPKGNLVGGTGEAPTAAIAAGLSRLKESGTGEWERAMKEIQQIAAVASVDTATYQSQEPPVPTDGVDDPSTTTKSGFAEESQIKSE